MYCLSSFQIVMVDNCKIVVDLLLKFDKVQQYTNTPQGGIGVFAYLESSGMRRLRQNNYVAIQ